MKHKILNIILAAAAAVIATAACTKEQQEDPNILSIAIQPDSLVVKAVGGVATFTFNAPDYWFVSSPVDWLTFEPESGKPGEVTLVVKAEEYHVVKERSAVITVNAKGRKGQCKIIQEAGEELPPPPDYSGTWSVAGTMEGSDWAKDYEMTDKGDLVWEGKIPYTEGDEFRFRMNGSWDMNMGLDQELTEGEGDYICSLKQDGPAIKLSKEGYWILNINLNTFKMVASFDSEFAQPEPKPLPDNWEPVWVNDGSVGEAAWDGKFRYGLEGNDGNNECVATFPQDVWDRLKSETFYVYLEGANPQIRVTTGWWTVNLTEADIQPGNELLADNEAGTWILTINLSEATELLKLLDEQHLLFTGGGFSVKGIYFEKKAEPKPLPAGWEPFWVNDGSVGEASWDGKFRYGLEGHDGNNECVATFPQDVWDRLKSETFYAYLEGANPQIRVTSGWWTVNLTEADIQPGSELLTDNDGGTWILTLNLSEATSLLDLLDEQHFLLTGSGFSVKGLYFDTGAAPVGNEIWDTETAFDSWSATIVIPAEKFADAKAGDIIRVYTSGKTGDYNPIFKHVETWGDWDELQGAKVEADDYFEAAIPAEALAELKEKGLRFQGVGFTLVKVVLIPVPVMLWDTETAFDSWSATIVIPAEKFADAKEGDTIRVYTSGKSGDYNPIFKHVETW